MQERIEKFEELLEKELKEELDKINDAGTITPDNLHTVKDAVKLMLKLKKYKEWLDGEGKYSNGYSNRRGRSATTGRYVSMDYGPMRSYDIHHSDEHYRRPYDGYSGRGSMMDQLERAYDNAQTEHERYTIKELMQHAEMSM